MSFLRTKTISVKKTISAIFKLCFEHQYTEEKKKKNENKKTKTEMCYETLLEKSRCETSNESDNITFLHR